ncbi:MAG: metallophosphoesterase [Methylobacteriaceae bacterium]|nr:metallophosphoesterase [Methylobacteriaceae bacterium]
MAKNPKAKKSKDPRSQTSEPISNTDPRPASEMQFAQPEPVAAPAHFRTQHLSDKAAYDILDKLRKQHALKPTIFPPSRGGAEPVLTLQQIWGSEADVRLNEIAKAGQIIFHAVGDTGNTRSVLPQEAVVDKMENDFSEEHPQSMPAFFFHLGDVVYSFGEAQYYYDQFYEPYRNYPAPIFALAGNHDGMVAPNVTARPLEAFLRNFCAEQPVHTPEAGGLDRTAMIQPGVYFTFEAPLVRIVCLYSNTLEDPGVISSEGGRWPNVTDVQLTFLETALRRVKVEKYGGALIIAMHHPAYTWGIHHNGSPEMLKEMDKVCNATGVWPHAVLSAHAHNYQRFTRAVNDMQIPYVVGGNGGHGKSPLRQTGGGVIRTPVAIPALTLGTDRVTFENYDCLDYGYLRVSVDARQLRIEYHCSSDSSDAKSPSDFVTVDLAERKLVAFDARSIDESVSERARPMSRISRRHA